MARTGSKDINSRHKLRLLHTISDVVQILGYMACILAATSFWLS